VKALRKEFELSDLNEFRIKYLNEDGDLVDLSVENWDQMKDLSETNQIQLVIEPNNEDKNQEEEEEEASNYEDDFEEPAPVEKVFADPVTLK
jgi:hypothetical protein